MNLAASLRALACAALDSDNRPTRLNFGVQQRALEHLLVLQRMDITEALMTGLHGRLTCVSSHSDLSEKQFLCRPVSVQIVTDRGQLHTINGIITSMRRGQSDGALCCYELTLGDALSVMKKRRNSRIFRSMNLPDVLHTLLGEWRQRSPALARAFQFDLSGLRQDRYPARELIRQDNETDTAFVLRLLRRDGVTVFVKAGPPTTDERLNRAADDSPVHTLVFCDDPMRLARCAAGTVRHQARDAPAGKRDSITGWSWTFELGAGRVESASWDYKRGDVHRVEYGTAIDQGEAGNDLAHLLSESVIDVPHVFDSWNDHERISRDRMHAREFQAARVDAMSGVRDLAVGFWVEVSEHPSLDTQQRSERQFVVTSLHHRADNSLPKDLDERATALFDTSRQCFDMRPSPLASSPSTASSSSGHPGTRYHNTFSCVRRGVPLTPAYDPAVDLPPDRLITAVVVGPKGEEVFVDELGRVRVQIQGLHPGDHAHAQGAGTNGHSGDSAPVRVACALAGMGFGASFPLRVGMEVLLGTVGGDPDRLVIIGALANGPNPPVKFSDTGTLPGNRYLAGTKAREIKGRGYTQVRHDSTPQQISVQMGTSHAYSEVNVGVLTQPRENGRGVPRGQGAELRSDESVAIRGGKRVLISAWEQFKASGDMLERTECLRMMQECVDLFKGLGDYAAQHRGVAMDTAPHEALAGEIKGWPEGATQQEVSSQEAATVTITAPGGVSTVTPKTVVTHAGGNVDTVALGNLQCACAQQMNLQAGQGISAFAQSGDVSVIANQGNVAMQSQTGDTQIESAKDIQLTAAGGRLICAANGDIIFVTSGGAYIKLSGADVEVGCPGQFIVKAAGHKWTDAASMSADMPTFDHAPLSRTPKLVRATDSQAVPGVAAEIRTASSEWLEARSDAAGELSPVESNRFEKLAVTFFESETSSA